MGLDGADLLPVSAQEFIEAPGRVVGGAGEQVGEPGLRVDVVHFG